MDIKKLGGVPAVVWTYCFVALTYISTAYTAENSTSQPLVLVSGGLRELTTDEAPDSSARTSSGLLGWNLVGDGYASGDGWWALVCDDRCALHATRLSVSAAQHPSYGDDPVASQFLHWSPLPYGLDGRTHVDSAKHATLIALFKPLDKSSLKFHSGPIKTWLHAGMDSYPAGQRMGTTETQIPLSGDTQPLIVPRLHPPPADPNASEVGGRLEFELRIGKQRQSLGYYDFDIEGLVPVQGKDYLLWAGDLDGDGKLDLIMQLSNYTTRIAMYLSSLAAPGALVGLAGEFTYDDPSNPGC